MSVSRQIAKKGVALAILSSLVLATPGQRSFDAFAALTAESMPTREASINIIPVHSSLNGIVYRPLAMLQARDINETINDIVSLNGEASSELHYDIIETRKILGYEALRLSLLPDQDVSSLRFYKYLPKEVHDNPGGFLDSYYPLQIAALVVTVKKARLEADEQATGSLEELRINRNVDENRRKLRDLYVSNYLSADMQTKVSHTLDQAHLLDSSRIAAIFDRMSADAAEMEATALAHRVARAEVNSFFHTALLVPQLQYEAGSSHADVEPAVERNIAEFIRQLRDAHRTGDKSALSQAHIELNQHLQFIRALDHGHGNRTLETFTDTAAELEQSRIRALGMAMAAEALAEQRLDYLTEHTSLFIRHLGDQFVIRTALFEANRLHPELMRLLPLPTYRREFTVRNIAVMIVGAILIGACYPYLILKTGNVPALNVLSGLLAFTMMRGILRSKNVTAGEINLVQTAMTSASTTGFMVVVIAAMDMLGYSLSPFWTFLWLWAGSSLGVLLMAPLRQYFIEKEKLPFPNGSATAAVLKSLTDGTGSGMKQAKALRIAAGFAAAFSALRDIFLWFPASIANQFKAGFDLSLLLLGSGILISLLGEVRTAITLLIFSPLVWVLGAEWLMGSGIGQQVAGVFGMEDELAKGNYFSVLLHWTMWPATAFFATYSTLAIALKWRPMLHSVTSLYRAVREGRLQSHDLSPKTLITGIIALTAALCLIQNFMLGISPLITIIAVAVSVPFMIAGLQNNGETGQGLVSPFANITQLIFAAISPGNIQANMLTSGTTGSIASASQDLSDDMKTASIVGTRAKAMVKAQLLIGLPIGALFAVLDYPLLKSMWGIGSEALPAPTAQKWAGLAQLLTKGWEVLPPSCIVAMLIAGAAGTALAFVDYNWTHWKWRPSVAGVGLALLLPCSMNVAIAIGGIAIWLIQRRWPRLTSLYAVPIAGGFLGGEIFIALVVSLLTAIGILSD